MQALIFKIANYMGYLANGVSKSRATRTIVQAIKYTSSLSLFFIFLKTSFNIVRFFLVTPTTYRFIVQLNLFFYSIWTPILYFHLRKKKIKHAQMFQSISRM